MTILQLLRRILRGFQALVHKRREEQDLDAELRTYVEMAIEHRMQSGMSRREASRAARLEMGSLESVKNEVREATWESTLGTLWQEMRRAPRTVSKDPLFIAVTLLTLALGIGASTAMFSVVNGVLLRPLPFPDPDRLVTLWETEVATGNRSRVPPGNYADWARSDHFFLGMGLYGSMVRTITGDGEPERILGAQVDGGYFPTLGVAPLMGRYIVRSDCREGAARVVVLSYGLWQRRFGGRDVVGTRLVLDGHHCDVVGVMPRGIYPTWPATAGGILFDKRYQQFWVPMQLGTFASSRTSHVFGVLGRLKSSATLNEAQGAMSALAANLAQAYPDANAGEGIVVTLLEDELTGSVRPALVMLLSAVGLLLFAGCANLAILSLARGAARMRELAVRAALGATRGRLIRQMLVENGLLALAGGLLGALVATAALPSLLALVPAGLPRLNRIAVDGRVLVFTAGLSFLTLLLFAVLPAVQIIRADPQESLRVESRGGTAGRGRERTRLVLVVVEMAVACVLLVGAGLLARSYAELSSVGLGFDPDRVSVAELSLPVDTSLQEAATFQQQLLKRVRALPGVVSAAVAYDHPMSASWIDSFRIPGNPKDDTAAWLRIVSPDYLETMRIPLRKGRTFASTDDGAHRRVAIVNEAFVRRFFSNRNPVGRRLVIPAPTRPNAPEFHEIVGIVGDVHSLGPSAEAEPAFYIPMAQFPQADFNLVLRTMSDSSTVAQELPDAVRSIDPSVPLGQITEMGDLVEITTAQSRFSALLVGLFGALAFVLAGTGVYGLLTYTVGQRTREIGVRFALGATPADVTRLILRRTLTITLVGVGIGTAVAAGLSHLLRSLFFRVAALDPLTFGTAAAALFIVSFAAGLIPVRRAARIDPLKALRDK